MTERKVAVFLYGLFMDMDGLQAASLDGYDIEIRDRATLLPRKEAWVYGIVTGLTHVEIGTLYAESSVRDYRPKPSWSPAGMGVRCQPWVISCHRSRAQVAIPRTRSDSGRWRRPSRSLPANLSFSSTTQGNKAVYALTVSCK